MKKLSFVGGAAFIFTTLSALAADLPYGADSLPYLARRSNAVILATAAERASSPKSDQGPAPKSLAVALFTVKVGEVLKGNIQKGASLKLAIPESINVKNVEQLNGSILFLAGPLEGEHRSGINVAGNDTIYLLISGRYGAVEAEGTVRLKAIRDYLSEGVNLADAFVKADQPKAAAPRLSWAERHLDSRDPFLQRSAILEVASHPKQLTSVDLLAKAVRSDAVTPQNKREAMNALQSTNSPQALQPLRELAENPKVPKPLREAAVNAVGAVPGGRDELRKWSQGEDKLLSPAAKTAVRRYEARRDRSGKQ